MMCLLLSIPIPPPVPRSPPLSVAWTNLIVLSILESRVIISECSQNHMSLLLLLIPLSTFTGTPSIALKRKTKLLTMVPKALHCLEPRSSLISPPCLSPTPNGLVSSCLPWAVLPAIGLGTCFPCSLDHLSLSNELIFQISAQVSLSPWLG